MRILFLFLLLMMTGCCGTRQLFFENEKDMSNWVNKHPKANIYIYHQSLMIEWYCPRERSKDD